MSSKQTARKRGASERAQRERRNEPASLCSFAGTGVTPVPRMRGCARPRMPLAADAMLIGLLKRRKRRRA